MLLILLYPKFIFFSDTCKFYFTWFDLSHLRIRI